MSQVNSIVDFHRRAKVGEALNVVFLGGSLTWGANASDPNQTSYRALMGAWLRERYPEARLTIHDAAIGGTGSELGMYRLDRDVLAKKPDLVFLDFTVNDGIFADNSDKLWSYETIVRRILASGSALQLVLLGVKESFLSPEERSTRRTQHLKIAEHYGLAIGDVYEMLAPRIAEGLDLEPIYPFEGTHPDDEGYALFCEAAQFGFEEAIADATASRLPEELCFDRSYATCHRLPLREGSLPKGWNFALTRRISLWFDGLSSRWLDDVVCSKASDQPEALTIEFSGTHLGVMGEAHENSIPFEIKVDGGVVASAKEDGLWRLDIQDFGYPKGNLYRWLEISSKLSAGPHQLELTPRPDAATDSEAELRIESLCFAE